MGSRVLSDEAAVVVELFRSDPRLRRYGMQILRLTGIKSGSLYPILIRLQKMGILTSEWEEVDEAKEGRRRRRYYALAPGGEAQADRELRKWAAANAKRHSLLRHRPRWITDP